MTTPDTVPVSAASSDGAGPGERTHRESVEARLIATGTVLDSIVQARRERIDELRARFGHLRAEELPRSQRSFADALRTRSGQSRSPQPALIIGKAGLGRTEGIQLTIEQDNLIKIINYLTQIMVDNQDNLACGFETAQCRHDNLFTDRVNPDERLVQKDTIRLLNQAASNQDPLELAAR